VAEGMAGACGGPFYQKAHLEGGAKIRWRQFFKNRVNILVLAQIQALRCLFFENGGVRVWVAVRVASVAGKFLRSASLTKWQSCRGGLRFFNETTWRGRRL
jgi:hypothetical protein